MIDWQLVFNVGTAIASLVIGGYVRFVQAQSEKARAEHDAMDKRLTDFQIKVAEKYVTHDDIRRIEDALIRIEAKIDVKQDK